MPRSKNTAPASARCALPDCPAMEIVPRAPRPGFVFAIRTADKDRKAYGGFEWPEFGPIECPDWKDTPTCGNGLHGLRNGAGDYTLLRLSDVDAIWQVVEVIEAECVAIGQDKVKFPRGNVIYSGRQATAMMFAALALQEETRGCEASSSGYGAPASSSGNRAPASSSGDYAPASSSGESSIACALGAASPVRAGVGGAVMAGLWKDGKLVGVRASMVGQDGVEPDKWYLLDENLNWKETLR